MRTLILAATHPRAAERTGDVGAFLEGLTAAELALTEPDTEQALDPLEARPGDLLDGRFRLQRRLGAGSTAVGLLVTDESARNVRRVLKVALDDRAATRLQATTTRRRSPSALLLHRRRPPLPEAQDLP